MGRRYRGSPYAVRRPKQKNRTIIAPLCLPYGKAGGLQILHCRRFAVAHTASPPVALALKPSDFRLG